MISDYHRQGRSEGVFCVVVFMEIAEEGKSAIDNTVLIRYFTARLPYLNG
jgi:hypothetical protein